MSEKEINFEEELNRLKEIVSLIQQKDLSLDESIKLYEEGTKIVKVLNEELKKAEAELMDLKLIKAQVLLQKGEKDKAAAILMELTHEDSTVKETAKELLEEIE